MNHFLQNDNMQGMAILQRPHEEAENSKKSKVSPFISSVTTDLNPVGLPPIRHQFGVIKKKNESSVAIKNKRIIRNIQILKKLEKETNQEEAEMDSTKYNKIKEISLKKNQEIDKIRQETYGYTSSTNKFNEEAKTNPRANWAKKEEDQEENIEDLISFAEKLDFEKYLKDLEIREALRLIKNRVEDYSPEKGENLPKDAEVFQEDKGTACVTVLPPIDNKVIINAQENEQMQVQFKEADHNKDWNVRQ